MESTYLDYNAYTPLDPQFIDAAKLQQTRDAGLFPWGGHLKSLHRLGKTARDFKAKAEEIVLRSIGVEEQHFYHYRIFHYPSATSANQAWISAYVESGRSITSLEVSNEEHPSIWEKVEALQRAQTGEASSKRESRLGLVKAIANSESGLISHIQSENLYPYTLRDGAAGWGKISLTPYLKGWGGLVLAPYKLGYPVGAGLLVLNKKTLPELESVLAVHEAPPVDAFVYWAICQGGVAYIENSTLIQQTMVAGLRTTLEAEIRGIKIPYELEVIDCDKERLPGTSLFCIKGAEKSLNLVNKLSLTGVCVSNGPACQSLVSRGSFLLRKRGYKAYDAENVIRVSLGKYSQPRDLDQFLESFTKIWQ